MPWEPPRWAISPEQLSDRWLGTCRKLSKQELFFEALGWGDRLNRLFAVACARAAFGGQLDPDGRRLVDLVEQAADGQVSVEELVAAHNALLDEADGASEYTVHFAADGIAAMLPKFAAAVFAGYSPGRPRPAVKRHRELFGKVLKAMVGPGWKWSDSWRTEPVVSVGRGIYEEHAWDRMPILADALVDAGCDDAKVRGYCRGDGPFCRGCWVLDMILQKRE